MATNPESRQSVKYCRIQSAVGSSASQNGSRVVTGLLEWNKKFGMAWRASRPNRVIGGTMIEWLQRYNGVRDEVLLLGTGGRGHILHGRECSNIGENIVRTMTKVASDHFAGGKRVEDEGLAGMRRERIQLLKLSAEE